jgi:hypothetical protein
VLLVHVLLIALHAAGGLGALGLGTAALFRPRLFPPSFALLLVALVALAGVVALDWAALDTRLRITYLGLLALAVVMALQGERARRLRLIDPPGYTAALGFTLVALADAFVVVSVLDLTRSPVPVAVSAVAVALAGHLLLRRRLATIARHAPAAPAPVAGSAGD